MSRRWKSSYTHPPRKGWYEIRRTIDGTTDWRAWGNGQWWKQTASGWIGMVTWEGVYQWRGPHQSIALDYAEVVK